MPLPCGDLEKYREKYDPDAVDRIRRQTSTGRPCGGSRFVVQLENFLGRVLRPAKRGRKPKPADGYRGEGVMRSLFPNFARISPDDIEGSIHEMPSDV
jgi:hypothetical protein